MTAAAAEEAASTAWRTSVMARQHVGERGAPDEAAPPAASVAEAAAPEADSVADSTAPEADSEALEATSEALSAAEEADSDADAEGAAAAWAGTRTLSMT